MFPLANMLHLFPHKFARLRGGRLPFALVFLSPFNSFLFWHSKMLSLPEIVLVVSYPSWGVQVVRFLRQTWKFCRPKAGCLTSKS